jgi:hypothetical protein
MIETIVSDAKIIKKERKAKKYRKTTPLFINFA